MLASLERCIDRVSASLWPASEFGQFVAVL